MCCEHGHPYECVCPGPKRCEVKLGDFDAIAPIETQSSHILGTKNYRSPEVEQHIPSNPKNLVITLTVLLYRTPNGSPIFVLIDQQKCIDPHRHWLMYTSPVHSLYQSIITSTYLLY